MEILINNNGILKDYGITMSPLSSKKLFSNLLNTCHWTNDTVTIFGKTNYMNIQSAWHGLDEYVYSYSGIIRKA
ncbi:MAG: hypothetical protein AB7O73_02510 [Bacteroidia bacterium]